MTARTAEIRQPSGDFVHFYDWNQVHDWAKNYVYTAFQTGWMVGNEGHFRPLDNISRAEVATTLNRTLNRVDSWSALEAIYLRNPYAVRDFPDVGDDGWYFPSVLAAANDHRLGRTEADDVTWKEILPEREEALKAMDAWYFPSVL